MGIQTKEEAAEIQKSIWGRNERTWIGSAVDRVNGRKEREDQKTSPAF